MIQSHSEFGGNALRHSGRDVNRFERGVTVGMEWMDGLRDIMTVHCGTQMLIHRFSLRDHRFQDLSRWTLTETKGGGHRGEVHDEDVDPVIIRKLKGIINGERFAFCLNVSKCIKM